MLKTFLFLILFVWNVLLNINYIYSEFRNKNKSKLFRLLSHEADKFRLTKI